MLELAFNNTLEQRMKAIVEFEIGKVKKVVMMADYAFVPTQFRLSMELADMPS